MLKLKLVIKNTFFRRHQLFNYVRRSKPSLVTFFLVSTRLACFVWVSEKKKKKKYLYSIIVFSFFFNNKLKTMFSVTG